MRSSYWSIRYETNMLKKWKKLIDTYHNVYSTKSLAQKLINECKYLLFSESEHFEFVDDYFDFDEKTKTLTVKTKYGKIDLINKQQVIIAKYSEEFIQNYEQKLKEYKEVDSRRDKTLRSWNNWINEL